jgi:RHS repeat-associated protein
MEMDNELKGEGNSYNTEFRQYDPRIGRWLSPDPLQKQLPWQSPYVGMDNKPIIRNDVDGDCPTCVSGFIIGGLMDMAFQMGEHMLQGDDIGSAFKKVDALQVLGNASLGAVTGAFDGGISKFAGALADPKKRKILTKVIEFGMETLLEEAVRAGYNVSSVEKQIYGLLGYKQLSSKAIGEIGEKSAKDLIKEKYKDSSVEVLEQIQGKFEDKTRTVFDFVVVDKETGDILEVVESKANGAKLTPNQKKFFDEGKSVELFGSNLKKAEEDGLSIVDKAINSKKVESTIVKSTVNKFTGKSSIEGAATFLKKIFKKNK